MRILKNNSLLMQGKLVLISGPSGSGKGSLIAGLKTKHPEFVFPLSFTSREMRKGEKDGEVYHFISKEDFEKKIKNDEFLEWAIVHQQNFYGTLKKPILEAIQDGKIVVREVDIQGFQSIRALIPQEKLISIFILPDSLENLIERIRKRSKISDEEIERRIASAKNEIAKSEEFDYIISNSDGKLEEALRVIEMIIEKQIF